MRKSHVLAAIMFVSAGAYAEDFTIPGLHAFDLRARSAAEEVTPPNQAKGYIVENDTKTGSPSRPIEWITIPGGTYMMGNDSGVASFFDAKPAHMVAIDAFHLSKTDVTVEQYKECVREGRCTKPAVGARCNWGVPGRERHPVNCVTWRLPTY